MPQRPPTQPLRLIPVAGPTTEPVVANPNSSTLIGRAKECEVYLPELTISRKHLTIIHQGGQWILTDLSSRHGSILNGTRLESNKPTPTGHGDLLHIGPYIFRVASTSVAAHTLATTDAVVSPGTIIEAVSVRQDDSLAHQRLALMIEGCAEIFQAQCEDDLAHAVIELILSGTGFPRGAMLRWCESPDQVEIIAFQDRGRIKSDRFNFSRSLLKASATGSVARLSSQPELQENHNYGQSIVSLGISEALSVPLIIDSTVIGSIYLDTRDGDLPPKPDATSFCHAVSHIASLALSNLKGIELSRRQEELDADLKIAQEAQTFLLPKMQGQVDNLRYVSRTCPGSVVGGDLFDIFEINDHQTGICFGDITGHGIGAAILMTAVLTHLRTALSNSGDPAIAVAQTNTYLADHSSARMFATLWVGVFDSTDNTLHYVDAGHGHWLVCTPENAPSSPPPPGGVVIGIQPDLEYTTASIKLREGDRLVIYSDGVVEQPNSGLDRFEINRLYDVLEESSSIEHDIAMCFAALEAFTGGKNFADDTTIASIEICPNSSQ